MLNCAPVYLKNPGYATARMAMESQYLHYTFASDSCNNNKDILCSMLLCLHAFIMAPVCQSVQYILTHKVTKYNCHMPVTIYWYIVIK